MSAMHEALRTSTTPRAPGARSPSSRADHRNRLLPCREHEYDPARRGSDACNDGCAAAGIIAHDEDWTRRAIMGQVNCGCAGMNLTAIAATVVAITRRCQGPPSRDRQPGRAFFDGIGDSELTDLICAAVAALAPVGLSPIVKWTVCTQCRTPAMISAYFRRLNSCCQHMRRLPAGSSDVPTSIRDTSTRYSNMTCPDLAI